MVLYLPIGVQGLDVDVLLPVAGGILAEEQPGQRIIDAGFPGGVVPVDGDAPASKVQIQIPVALKIFQCQPIYFDFRHCNFLQNVLQ